MTRLYEAAGLGFLTPVCGLTEIGTMSIVLEAGLRPIMGSCGRGTLEPCRACVKCLRKGLETAMLSGRTAPDDELAAVIASPAVIRALTERPIHLESVYAWACARYTGAHPAMEALCDLVAGHADVCWNERFYGPSLERLPARYRMVLESSIPARVEPMTPTDIATVRGWRARSADPATRHLTGRLRRALITDPRRRLWVDLRSRLGRLWRRVRRIE